MRAILLAAGFGTRLRPMTNTVPKCLVSINGQPLLDIWLKNLTEAGIGPCIVNTHYLANQVKDYIAGSRFRDSVIQIHEDILLGTAGTLISNANFFCEEGGLLIHADNYCDVDWIKFLDVHNNRPSGCEITMMTFRTNTPLSCGIVEIDERGVVIGFHEKVSNPPGNLANGAVYALSKEAVDSILLYKKNATDFSTEVLPFFIGKILAHEVSGPFVDIGTPEMYELANVLRANQGVILDDETKSC